LESNFFRYFAENFEHLGIKKLISTHYDEKKSTYKLEVLKDINKDGKINLKDAVKTKLKQNGDFRSDECVEILKEADIVMGNTNAITYKEIFKLIKETKIWLGQSIHSGDVEFRVPEHYEVTSKSLRIDKDGNKYIRVPSIR
jgi:hypothetical protein